MKPGAVGLIPEPGERNHEVFCELGHGPSELEAWTAEGAIWGPSERHSAALKQNSSEEICLQNPL